MNFTPLEVNIFEDFEELNKYLDEKIRQCKKASKPTVCKIEGHLTTELSLNEVIFFNPYTILFYTDDVGNKDYVISKCSEQDVYDKNTGVKLCALKATKRMVEKEIKKF